MKVNCGLLVVLLVLIMSGEVSAMGDIEIRTNAGKKEVPLHSRITFLKNGKIFNGTITDWSPYEKNGEEFVKVWGDYVNPETGRLDMFELDDSSDTIVDAGLV